MAYNDTNSEVIPDILISLESYNEDSTETLSLSPTKPPMTEANNYSKFKRSYLERNENMDRADRVEEEEIIMINNVRTINAVPEGNNNNSNNNEREISMKRHCVDPECAAESVSRNPSFLKAMKTIKSDLSATTSNPPHKPLAIKGGVQWRDFLVAKALETGNNNSNSNDNPDNFLNVDNELSDMPLENAAPVEVPLGNPGQHPLMKRIRTGYVADSEIELIKSMPTVKTDGGIGDGRRVEGILYSYKKYEEVIIICACHGYFLSPREFVMHAGGAAEVDNPLRLIMVVNCPIN